jgi:hypothetical protein
MRHSAPNSPLARPFAPGIFLEPDMYAELRAERSAQRELRNALMRHPDQRDPDYPADDDYAARVLADAVDALMGDRQAAGEAPAGFTDEQHLAIAAAVARVHPLVRFGNSYTTTCFAELGRLYYSSVLSVLEREARK